MQLAEKIYRPLIPILVIFSGLLYYNIGYNTLRTNFLELMFQITILFTFLVIIWYYFKRSETELSLRIIQYSGIFFRIILLFSVPSLSDDFYRFLWDGNMTNLNFNPYLILPETYAQASELNLYMKELFENMNSRAYFAVYPPLNQFIFSFVTLIFPEDLFKQIIFLRLILFIAELLIIFNLPVFLQKIGISNSISALYILNPLVILEITGNLHFEGLAIWFLLLTLSFIKSGKWKTASVFYSLSIGIKLLPLIFLPVLIRFLGIKRGIFYAFTALFINLLLFLPFMDLDAFVSMFSSIELYFNKFEFNASVYYIIRSVGYQIWNYNIIQTAGIVLSIITIAVIFLLALKVTKDNYECLIKYMFFSLLVYFLFSTTVHPWYIITALFLSVLCNYHRSVFLWSWIIFTSYHTYISQPYSENILVTALSYLIVFSALIFDTRRNDIHVTA